MAIASMSLHYSLAANSALAKGTAKARFLPSGNRAARFAVKCQAKQESSPDQEQPANTQMQSSTAPSSPIPPPPIPAPKASPSFFDVLAFSGPAPERINGRLAMVGFVAALGAEVAQGHPVLAQLTDGGLPWFVGATAVLSLASLIPLFKGVSVQSKSEGLMTADAELWNGRFAMLGIVALVFTEYLKGGALV